MVTKSEYDKAWRRENREKIREYNAIWKKQNREKIREYDRQYKQSNKDKINERQRAYQEANKEKVQLQVKAYKVANREKLAAKQRLYNHENKEKIAARCKIRKRQITIASQKYQREYIKSRRQININVRLRTNLGNRLRDALRGRVKAGSILNLLGCTVEELKIYLENKFSIGMTWGNWGEWHIDHIVPMSAFDLSDPASQAQAMHHTNLQPLWATDNRIKRNKLDYKHNI